MQRRSIIVPLLGLAASVTVLEAVAQEAQAWLYRMTQAIEDLSYQGTFVHVVGGEAETLQIVHINDGGRVSERIVSMDGVGREIIRHEDQVQCILPDRRVVMLDERREVSPLISALPAYSEDLQRHYEFSLHRTEPVAERNTQMVGIKPKDEFRYGYMLWLDSETAMPLKSQLKDERGRTVEQILFTQIEISNTIPASALEPTIDTQGFEWLRAQRTESHADDGPQWRASRLPRGFKLSVATRGPIAGSQYPVEHLVYSDGLATVSVFIENPNTKPEMARGFSQVGSANAYSLSLSGRQVTAVGEVPRRTVETIATSLQAP